MQKNVPTLLGILILLVAVVLVVLIYNIKLTQELGVGGRATGTIGGEMLTGEDAPTTYTTNPEQAGGGQGTVAGADQQAQPQRGRQGQSASTRATGSSGRRGGGEVGEGRPGGN
jgi:hypothetical protein